MSIDREAKKVAKYAKSLSKERFCVGKIPRYTSMGAVILDSILQAGLSYDSVVLPRVKKFCKTYPEAKTVSQFIKAAQKDGWEVVCDWKHKTKLDRIKALAKYLQKEKVDSVADFKKWVKVEGNADSLLLINGVKEKTRDYLQQRVGLHKVAVDVHIRNFLKKAGVNCANYGYEEIAEIVACAGKIINMNRSEIDGAIWRYMGKSKSQ